MMINKQCSAVIEAFESGDFSLKRKKMQLSILLKEVKHVKDCNKMKLTKLTDI